MISHGVFNLCLPYISNMRWHNIEQKVCHILQACNHLVCGYDAGDCGTSNYDQLIGMDLRREEDQHYVVPAGEPFSLFLGVCHAFFPLLFCCVDESLQVYMYVCLRLNSVFASNPDGRAYVRIQAVSHATCSLVKKHKKTTLNLPCGKKSGKCNQKGITWFFSIVRFAVLMNESWTVTLLSVCDITSTGLWQPNPRMCFFLQEKHWPTSTFHKFWV